MFHGWDKVIKMIKLIEKLDESNIDYKFALIELYEYVFGKRLDDPEAMKNRLIARFDDLCDTEDRWNARWSNYTEYGEW